ncbi:MAG: OmpA family protein [Polyangiaceae bacterium]
MRSSRTTLRRVALSGAVALAGAALVACSDTPPAQTVDGANTSGNRTASTAPAPTTSSKGNDDQKSNVSIEDKILKACGDVPVAHFGFDAADVQADAANALDAIARCFVTGPLKGHAIKLIGYADPRGDTEYNLRLGQRRAGSVGDFLQKKGMEQSKVRTSSKGEFEATGTDETGWAQDRKVEILLGD